MKFLLDTHLLLWASDFEAGRERMSREASDLIADERNLLHFSAASIWEVTLKHERGRADFTTKPQALHEGLLRVGYIELPINGLHAVAVTHLPSIHKDPFDRVLLAQAQVERLTLLTADATLARYPVPVRLV